MDPVGALFVWLVGAAVSVIVLYCVIRLAVTHAIRAAAKPLPQPQAARTVAPPKGGITRAWWEETDGGTKES